MALSKLVAISSAGRRAWGYLTRTIRDDITPSSMFGMLKVRKMYDADLRTFRKDLEQIKTVYSSGKVMRMYRDDRAYPSGALGTSTRVPTGQYRMNFILSGHNARTGEPMGPYYHMVQHDAKDSSADVRQEAINTMQREITDLIVDVCYALWGLKS